MVILKINAYFNWKLNGLSKLFSPNPPSFLGQVDLCIHEHVDLLLLFYYQEDNIHTGCLAFKICKKDMKTILPCAYNAIFYNWNSFL